MMTSDQNTNMNVDQIRPRSAAEIEEVFEQVGQRRKREVKRWYARSAKPIKQIIADLMVRRGLGRVLATEQLNETWREIVGDPFAAQSQPGQLRGGILEIVVAHTAYKQEMQYMEEQILAQLHEQAADMKIRGLRYRVGQIH